MAKRSQKFECGVIPPREANVDAFKDVLTEYVQSHTDCTDIRFHKKVPADIIGLVIEVGLSEPLSEDIFDRYRKVAADLAELTREKITLMPMQIGIVCNPKQEG